MTLFIGGDKLYARTQDGRLFDLDEPAQALLMVGEELPIRPLTARARKSRPKGRLKAAPTGSERLSRGRRPAAQ